MRLLFKQRFFSILDSYEIFDEDGNIVYNVKSELALGHVMNVFSATGDHLGTIQQRLITLLPKFDIFIDGQQEGTIAKRFRLLTNEYDIEYKGWHVDGDFMGWDYAIYDYNNHRIATVTKELFRWTDTYALDIVEEMDALPIVMLVLAIDAEKCSSANAHSHHNH